MTEHAAVIFVFFFLAEYASIVLICILISILFLGGYLSNLIFFTDLVQYIDIDYYIYRIENKNPFLIEPFLEGMFNGISLGLKTCIMIFVFI